MSDNKLDRKAFLKSVGLGIGAMAIGIPSALANFENDESLSLEKRNFLNEYKNWLSEFQDFVGKRNENTLNTENNLKLMELSKQAEKRKPQMEKFMEDDKFADYFNKITNNITHMIKK